jgi:hypothetical protein
MWCIAKGEDAAFVAAMEDILDLYCQPFDPEYPVVCMDEKPYQLLDEVRKPIPMAPGRIRKVDAEYVRKGTCSIFVFGEPLTGWTHAHAREHRTKVDWAEEICWLLDEIHPGAKKIRLVSDNLNTHVISSLYQAFEAPKARALTKRLEMHHTPKHGSWLNIAEIFISILARQCLCRRISDLSVLNRELAAWAVSRNTAPNPVDWQFSTNDARIKLKHLYPNI